MKMKTVKGAISMIPITDSNKSMNGLSEIEPRGLIHLYTGDGKGKTTAAAGLAIRAAGAGKKVLFCQFLKGMDSCELTALRSLGVEVVRAQSSEKFLFNMDETELERTKCEHEDCFAGVSSRILAGEFEVTILDEVVDAVNCGFINEVSLLKLLESHPQDTEIIMTGREPGERLAAAADYHTDFVCKKHPYQKGVSARKGIEY